MLENKITRITDKIRKEVKNKTAYSLPNNPADVGMKAQQTKPKFYDGTMAVLEYVDNLAKESVQVVDEFYGKFELHKADDNNPHKVVVEQLEVNSEVFKKEDNNNRNVLETFLFLKALCDALGEVKQDKEINFENVKKTVETVLQELITLIRKNKLEINDDLTDLGGIVEANKIQATSETNTLSTVVEANKIQATSEVNALSIVVQDSKVETTSQIVAVTQSINDSNKQTTNALKLKQNATLGNPINGNTSIENILSDVNGRINTIVGVNAGETNLGTLAVSVSTLQTGVNDIRQVLTSNDVDYDTLQELVNALKNNVSSIGTIMSTLATKVNSNDSRLTNARPASDVYPWAKEQAKPSYSGNEILTDSSDKNKDLDVAQYLRWQRHGNEHVIIEASKEIAPNGTPIMNYSVQENWVPGHPYLVGWNGYSTYGVKVNASENADKLAGLEVSSKVGKNTIVTRDSSGYSFFNYVNSDTSDNENANINQIITTNGDSFYRKSSIQQLKTSLSFVADEVSALANNKYTMLTCTPIGDINAGESIQMLEIKSPISAPCSGISFHKSGEFACNFGLNSSNKLSVGGWSMGNNMYKVYHEGEKPAARDIIPHYDTKKASWGSAEISNNNTIFGLEATGSSDENVVFSSSANRVNMIIDGDYYAKDGQHKAMTTNDFEYNSATKTLNIKL